MSLFGKIYSAVLILFVVIMTALTLQVAKQRIAETEKFLVDKHRVTGSMITSEIKRWHAQGMWPFEALKKISEQSGFLFWWIVDDDNLIHLADKVEYVGTVSTSYFPEIREQFLAQNRSGNVVLNKADNYGIFYEAFTVGNERWSFWLGFSSSSIQRAVDEVIISTVIYSSIGLILIGVVLFFIIRRYLKPVGDLSLGVQRIGDGDLDYRLTLQSRDEIGVVAHAFNQMADSLQKDISERERMQADLAVAFERFKAVLDSIDGLIYVADMDTYELLFINKYGRDIWGDVTGKLCWQTLQSGQEGPCAFCTNDKLIDDEGNPRGTYIWEFQNTVTNEWYECRDTAIKWTDSRLVRMEIATNITERKQQEEALAEEKERLAVTLRSIGDGVITTDTTGTIVLLNKVAEKLTGWKNEEAVGQPLERVFHIINEKTGEKCKNPVANVLQTGRIVELANHTVLISKDGNERHIADSGAPILDMQSNIIGVVLVFRDVTEKKITEKELLKVKKLESIGVLAGGIAHDFNNILAAIIGNINLALIDSNLSLSTKNLLAEAEKASLRARDLTQQLLTFSKGGDPVKELSSLAEVIKDSAEFVLHGDKVACRYILPQDLWLVDVDRGQISQVIQNIVLNASHAMPEGGVINITCENLLIESSDDVFPFASKGKYVKITIADNGVGIPESQLEMIFDPYFTTKHEGSGLGLAITQSIINKHNGHIFAESSLGVGTTFYIFLPASEATTITSEKKIDKLSQPASGRVLVMDDDEMVRDMTENMLVSLGYTVVLSENGLEAVNLYQQSLNEGKRFDLAILDLTVPGGMGGKEAVQEILSIDPEAKVIVSSGYSNDPVMANYKDYGFCGIVVKPYRLKELSSAIIDHIDS